MSRPQKRLIRNQEIPFLGDLPKDVLDSLNSVAVYRSFIPKNYIVMEGKPSKTAFLIIKGTVNIFRISFNGRKQVLARLGPGDWINAIGCLKDEENCPATGLALTPVKVLAISKKDLSRLVNQYPTFAQKITDNAFDRIKMLVNVIENLSLRSTSGRVAYFLLGHADESDIIHWQCTQKDIADRLGTVADVVGRVLRKFADDGLIEMPVNKCIVLIDKEGLQQETLK